MLSDEGLGGEEHAERIRCPGGPAVRRLVACGGSPDHGPSSCPVVAPGFDGRPRDVLDHAFSPSAGHASRISCAVRPLRDDGQMCGAVVLFAAGELTRLPEAIGNSARLDAGTRLAMA